SASMPFHSYQWRCLDVRMHLCVRRRTLFPYTTLFRSPAAGVSSDASVASGFWLRAVRMSAFVVAPPRSMPCFTAYERRAFTVQRSDEHTSELQSRENSVCRLLLEKKKENQ